MSATARKQVRPDEELWVVADSGDVDELARVFAMGAHVNARNKHGMTALMKAAYHGHARMVRALLEHGADPNLARHDKFTALAIAAFFGHTEIVKILIEYGAKVEVIAGGGASAQTWATRRTYLETASCLNSRAPAPALVPAPVPAAAPTVIRTLKDPPEIWDLVHEAPRSFNATSAFVSRLTSKKTTLPFLIAAVVVVSTVCVVGALMLKGIQAPVEAPAKQDAVATEVRAPVSVESTKSETPTEPAPEPAEFSHHSQSSSVDEKPARKPVLTRQIRSRAEPMVTAPNLPTVQSREVPTAVPVIAPPQVQVRNTSVNKPNTSLSPQLIAPAKGAPPKGKVIQWP
jgi:hypothetical protein